MASSSTAAVVEVEDMSRVESVDSGGEVSTAADNKVSGGPGRGPCWPSLARRSTDNNNNANYTLIIITPPHSLATIKMQNTQWKQTNANDRPLGWFCYKLKINIDAEYRERTKLFVCEHFLPFITLYILDPYRHAFTVEVSPLPSIDS